MSHRSLVPFVFAAVAVGFAVAGSRAYIHFPPMTLPKMCKDSHCIRALKVEKFDKEKGVIVYAPVDAPKVGGSPIDSLRHVVRPDATGAKSVLDWAAAGKTAVMFTIEWKGRDGQAIGCGYVFVDESCYSVDYNAAGKFWLVMRGEPEMSACYFGPVDRLRELVKDCLAGKEVKVPVKVRAEKPDSAGRRAEITKQLQANRGLVGK